jgi:hypothetical protein
VVGGADACTRQPASGLTRSAFAGKRAAMQAGRQTDRQAGGPGAWRWRACGLYWGAKQVGKEGLAVPIGGGYFAIAIAIQPGKACCTCLLATAVLAAHFYGGCASRSAHVAEHQPAGAVLPGLAVCHDAQQGRYLGGVVASARKRVHTDLSGKFKRHLGVSILSQPAQAAAGAAERAGKHQRSARGTCMRPDRRPTGAGATVPTMQ